MFNNMKQFMPYLLPAVSLLIIAGFLIVDPNITGFAVRDQSYDANIKISTYEFVVMPENSIVEVLLVDSLSKMTFKEFIDKTGDEYELREGKFEDIGFEGVGYSGNHEYFLPISEFGFDSLEEGQTITIRVRYENYLISESVIPVSNK